LKTSKRSPTCSLYLNKLPDKKTSWRAYGKPIQNAFVESFNSRFRDECLNEELFHDLADAKKKIEKWRKYYNEERPHSSIDMKTPNEFERGFKFNNAG
jgi:transposase InsO family protein